MIESVVSKTVLDPHLATAGAGIIGVGIGVGVGITTGVGVITTLLFAAMFQRSLIILTKKWGG